MNYNIRLSLWWTVLENVSGSIRAGDSLSAFVYLLTGKNSTVGFIQGVNGVMQLLTAFPAGVIADRTRRDAVLRAGAAIGLAGGATLWWAVARAKSAMAVAVAMALLGTYRGVYSPAMEAIFADSVVTGRT